MLLFLHAHADEITLLWHIDSSLRTFVRSSLSLFLTGTPGPTAGGYETLGGATLSLPILSMLACW